MGTPPNMVFELGPPAGSVVAAFPNAISFNPSTGLYRAIFCVNPSTGEVIFNDTVTNGGFQSVLFPLTSAQILALNSSPVQALPAPGAGLAYEILGLTINLIAGTTAYSGGAPIELQYAGGQIALTTASTNPFTATNNSVYFAAGNIAQTFVTANIINKAINLIAAANPTLGNGTAEVTVYYRTIPLQ